MNALNSSVFKKQKKTEWKKLSKDNEEKDSSRQIDDIDI